MGFADERWTFTSSLRVSVEWVLEVSGIYSCLYIGFLWVAAAPEIANLLIVSVIGITININEHVSVFCLVIYLVPLKSGNSDLVTPELPCRALSCPISSSSCAESESQVQFSLSFLLSDPDWASHSLGIFICLNCSGIHRNIPQVSKVKSVRLDDWDDAQVEVRASETWSTSEFGSLHFTSKAVKRCPFSRCHNKCDFRKHV